MFFIIWNKYCLFVQDSGVALEALVAYSYRARIRSIMDLSITIEFSSQPNTSHNVAMGVHDQLADMRNIPVGIGEISRNISMFSKNFGNPRLGEDFFIPVGFELYLQ